MNVLQSPYLKIFLILLAFPMFSQHDRAIDSLETLLKKAKSDTNQVLLLDKILVKYQNAAKYDKALLYAETAIRLAESLNYQKGKADVYNNMANTLYLKGDYVKAIGYHKLAINIRKELKDQKRLGRSYNNLGSCYDKTGDYKNALEYFILSLKIKEELKDSLGIYKAFNNIGNLNLSLKNYKKALEYFQLAYEIAKQLNDEAQMAMTLDNIATVYDELQDKTKALEYDLAAEKIAIKVNDRQILGSVYNNLASLYDYLKQFELSKNYYIKSLKIWEEDGNDDGIASTCINLGQCYQAKKDYKTAALYFERSLKYKQHKSILAETYGSLSKLYEATGDYKNATKNLTLYSAIQSELYKENLSKQLIEFQTKYETEKKNKENLELKRKNETQDLLLKAETQKRRNQFIIGLCLIVLILIVAYFLYYRRKQLQKTLMLAELTNQEKIRFKAIIEAEEKERSRIAQDLHDGLGQMLAASRMQVSVLKNLVSDKEKQLADKALDILNDAYQEVRTISHNMMPNALMRLGLIAAIRELIESINETKTLNISFSSNVEASLGKEMDITIYRIMQEVLNNMIKHARADRIIMEINKKDENLNISISDNGIGFDVNMLKDSKGLGWKGIYSRVSMLEGTIKLDSILKKGTIIYINLKLKKEE